MYQYSVLRCDHLLSEKIFENALSSVSKDRAEKISKYKNSKSRVESLGATLTLEKMLEACGISKPFLYSYSENGKPYLRESHDTFISLSHSHLFAVAAVGNRPVGIDVEKIRDYENKIADRFFTEEDKKLLQVTEKSLRNEMFFKIWTFKEAFAKAVDIPVARLLDKVRYGQSEFEGRRYACDHAFMGDMMITIVEECDENT